MWCLLLGLLTCIYVSKRIRFGYDGVRFFGSVEFRFQNVMEVVAEIEAAAIDHTYLVRALNTVDVFTAGRMFPGPEHFRRVAGWEGNGLPWLIPGGIVEAAGAVVDGVDETLRQQPDDVLILETNDLHVTFVLITGRPFSV